MVRVLVHSGTVVRRIGGGHGKRSEVCGRAESLVRQGEGDVVSPSRGRAEDKAVAAWAMRGGREGRWRAMADAQGARWRAVWQNRTL
jgi:hypothetical protein